MPDLRCEDSIVRIEGRSSGAGTGFIIFQDDEATYILTCQHVVDFTVGSKEERSMLIDGEYEAYPIHEAPEGTPESLKRTPDLAVLKSNAKELRSKPALKLGPVVRSRAQLTIAGYFKLTSDETKEVREVYARIKAKPRESEVLLDQDSDFQVIPGNSGSPVLDDEFGCVIAVVDATPRQSISESEGKVIHALPISLVQKIWKDIPPEVFFEFTDPEQVSVEPELDAKLKRLGTIPLRILLAASTPTGSSNVNSETAKMKETLHRVFAHPALRQHFALEVYESVGTTQVRLASRQSSAEQMLARQPLSEFDLVVMVIWQNIGSSDLDLEELDREARGAAAQSKFQRPVRWFYRRTDEALAGLEDPRRLEWDRQNKRKDAFFVALQGQSTALISSYRKQEFNSLFMTDLWRFIGNIVDAESGRKEIAAPVNGKALIGPGGD